MSGSVNKVILVGNVCADAEIRTFGNGGRVANLSVATNDEWRDKSSGEKKQRTEYHRVAIFNDGLVGIVERFVKKGSKVYIEGKLQTRKWQDRDGNDKYTTEVVLQGFGGALTLLDSRNQSGEQSRSPSRNTSSQGNGGGYGGASQDFDISDEIPF